MTSRRSALVLVAAGVLGARGVFAQAGGVPTVGFIRRTSATGSGPFVKAFREGLKESGFVEGRDVAIEFRWADGRMDRLAAGAADLVRRRVAVLFAGGGEAALAAKSATSTIPVVFVTGDDPLKVGLVTSLSRPSGNVTGVAFGNSDLVAKRLEILRELVPNIGTVGLFYIPASESGKVNLREAQAAAQAIDQKLVAIPIADDASFDPAFAQAAQQHVGALLVGSGALFTNQRERIVALAARYSIPAMFDIREGVEAGGLISYGSSITNAYREAAVYVGRILKGAKPGDLPVMQSDKYDLVINRKTLKQLGLAMPSSLALLAEVID